MRPIRYKWIRHSVFLVLLCCPHLLYADITEEEYSLLSAVLTHGFGENCKQIAIEEKTSAGSVAMSTKNRPLTEVAEILGLDEAMLAEWERLNLEFDYLEERFDLACDYHLLSAKKLATVFGTVDVNNPENGWRNFKRTLPNLVGIMRLAKPAIDPQTKSALAYVEFDCGAGCGSGRFVTLAKDNENRWQVTGGSLVWMATE